MYSDTSFIYLYVLQAIHSGTPYIQNSYPNILFQFWYALDLYSGMSIWF